jgi:methionyl-tRNA formyltransferase
MNIVFFGTSEFAIPSLKALIASPHGVLALVTQPDRKRGRNLKLSPPPAKVLAETHDIPVYQPQDASSAGAARYLKSLNPDLFIVISFGQILKKEILSIPGKYAINLHGSLLPKYRGAAPTNWAVIKGERKSGVTVIKMNEKMDEGDMILKRPVPIDDEDTNITLSEKLAEEGSIALIDAVGMIEKGQESFEAQDHSQATYAPKLKKEDGLIDWSAPAPEIRDMIKGMIPWPGAYTYYQGKILKILHARICADIPAGGIEPGSVAIQRRPGEMVVGTGSGMLSITHLQLQGGKALDAASFLRGHRIPAGYSLTTNR